MELRHLRYFVSLAEDLSFTRAAQRLHIVQPALSQQIRELEEELGGELFHRNKRMVELSAAGRAFLPQARRILKDAENAAAQARRVLKGEAGRIGIGYSAGAILSGALGRILRRYREAFPQVELQMRQVSPGTQAEALLRGDVDIIFGMSDSLERLRNCTTFMLARYPLVLVMHSTHRLAANDAVNVRELRSEPFIAYAEPGEKHGREIIREAVGFNPEIAYSSGDLLFVSALVEAGFGLAVMPTAMLRAFSGAVSAKPLAGTEVSFGLAAAVRKAGVDSAVTNLITIAMKESGETAVL